MKTALQELIERFCNPKNLKQKNVIHITLHRSQMYELLEKEREQLVKAWQDGNQAKKVHDYYNETFKQ